MHLTEPVIVKGGVILKWKLGEFSGISGCPIFPLKKAGDLFQDFESQCIITVSCVKSCNFWMNPPESVEDREMSRVEYWNI